MDFFRKNSNLNSSSINFPENVVEYSTLPTTKQDTLLPSDVITSIDNALTGNLDYRRALEMAQIQNNFNAREAQKVRDYDLYMSNTAYQRMFDDLKAAGLNPVNILGSSGGADFNAAPTARSGSQAVGNKSPNLLTSIIGGLVSITNSAINNSARALINDSNNDTKLLIRELNAEDRFRKSPLYTKARSVPEWVKDHILSTSGNPHYEREPLEELEKFFNSK